MSNEEEIKKFVETYNITFPVGRDKEIAKKFGVIGLPTTLFISKNGSMFKRHGGIIAREELGADIEALLK